MGDCAFRGQKTTAECARNVIVLSDLGCIHRLQVSSGPNLFTDEVFDICYVKAVWLRCCPLCNAVGIQRCHFECKAQIFFDFKGDIIQIGHTGAELSQRDIFRLLSPYHWSRKRGGGHRRAT